MRIDMGGEKGNLKGYVRAALLVGLATLLFFPGRDIFSKGQWALLYILIVAFISALNGVRPGLLASVLAFFAWNYFFLPPYLTFTVSDPKDWLSLFVFLVVGVLIGIQTGRLRERETRALTQERKAALLSRFSARLVKDASVSNTAKTLVDEARTIIDASPMIAFVNDDGQVKAVASSPVDIKIEPRTEELARWVCANAKAIGLPTGKSAGGFESDAADWPISASHTDVGWQEESDMFIPFQTAARQTGVLYVGKKKGGQLYSQDEVELLVAIANQFAVFLERKHLQRAAIQADVMRETDRLKSTLLSSVSHELKTPLASLEATVTNLLEGDLTWNREDVERELQAIREDAVRLGGSIGSLIDLSRLESSTWRPKPEPWPLGEILGTVISRIPADQRARIECHIPEDLPLVNVDFVQLARVLFNLLDNALTYGGKGSPVLVRSAFDSREIRLTVEDRGPGVPSAEREKIFNRFFRGTSATASPAGTGLGLAIAREIVRFHGGRIWVEPASPKGARFVISLPREEVL